MERKYSIDLLRVISAIAVVIIHTVCSPVGNSLFEFDSLLIKNLDRIHALMNWSVPVFFMITGYCLLRKEDCSYVNGKKIYNFDIENAIKRLGTELANISLQ